MSENKLSDKQKRFCDHYLISFNATQSAIKAGYSKKTAHSIGSENLIKPEIQKYLQSKKEKIAKKLEISQERTMLEMARISFSSVLNLYNEDGTFKPIHELDDNTAAAIQSLELNEDGEIIKIKLWDKNKPMEMLGKHFKIYADITPVVVNNTFDIGSLSAEDLKQLLALKKKAGK